MAISEAVHSLLQEALQQCSDGRNWLATYVDIRMHAAGVLPTSMQHQTCRLMFSPLNSTIRLSSQTSDRCCCPAHRWCSHSMVQLTSCAACPPSQAAGHVGPGRGPAGGAAHGVRRQGAVPAAGCGRPAAGSGSRCDAGGAREGADRPGRGARVLRAEAGGHAAAARHTGRAAAAGLH